MSGYNEYRLPEDHWCRGCVFGYEMTDRVVCPFVEGSCARMPETILEPDREKFHTRSVAECERIEDRVIENEYKKASVRQCTHNGRSYMLSEIAKMEGIPKSVVKFRLQHGWDAEMAFTTKIRSKESANI